MTHDTQVGIINLIKNRAKSLDSLHIEWFGGEPLMAKDIIYKLSKKIMAISSKNNIKYSAGMTTNAYLLDKKCYENLVKYGVNSFQITLDGEKEIHDNIRKRVDGKGTFDVIMKNLLEIQSSSSMQSSIMLRLHYTPNTWKSTLRLVNNLKKTLLIDSRFQVVFRAVGKWGGKNDDILDTFEKQLDEKNIQEILINHLVEKENTFKRQSIDAKEKPDDFYVCYASKANNLVVRATGGLAKCTVALSHPNNDVGYLTPEGKIKINQTRFKKWLIGFQTGNHQQLGCPASSALKDKKSSIASIPVVSIPA